MAGITIKALNNQYICTTHFTDFNEFLIECEAKLKNCASKSEGFFKVFFHFEHSLNSEQLIRFFECTQRNRTIVLGLYDLPSKQPLRIWKTPLFAGQTYTFYEDTLLIGNILKDTHVNAHGNLYVLGDIEGFVDMIYPHCECYCSSLNDGNLRIFDTTYQNLTIFTPTKLYYKDHEVAFCKIREGFYGN